MFDNIIQPMMGRLGWSINDIEDHVALLDDDNKASASGLFLNNYHGLIVLGSMHATHPDEDVSKSKFNSYLNEILDNVIREILTDVFVADSNPIDVAACEPEILASIAKGTFDNCIGYCHAVKCVERMITAVRSNRVESIMNHNYDKLSVELKGFVNDSGVVAVKGLIHECRGQRKMLKQLFSGEIEEVYIKDETNKW